MINLPSRPQVDDIIPTGWFGELWDALLLLGVDTDTALRLARTASNTTPGSANEYDGPFKVEISDVQEITVGYLRAEAYYPNIDIAIQTRQGIQSVLKQWTAAEALSVTSTGLVYYEYSESAGTWELKIEATPGNVTDADYTDSIIVPLAWVIYYDGAVQSVAQLQYGAITIGNLAAQFDVRMSATSGSIDVGFYRSSDTVDTIHIRHPGGKEQEISLDAKETIAAGAHSSGVVYYELEESSGVWSETLKVGATSSWPLAYNASNIDKLYVEIARYTVASGEIETLWQTQFGHAYLDAYTRTTGRPFWARLITETVTPGTYTFQDLIDSTFSDSAIEVRGTTGLKVGSSTGDIVLIVYNEQLAGYRFSRDADVQSTAGSEPAALDVVITDGDDNAYVTTDHVDIYGDVDVTADEMQLYIKTIVNLDTVSTLSGTDYFMVDVGLNQLRRISKTDLSADMDEKVASKSGAVANYLSTVITEGDFNLYNSGNCLKVRGDDTATANEVQLYISSYTNLATVVPDTADFLLVMDASTSVLTKTPISNIGGGTDEKVSSKSGATANYLSTVITEGDDNSYTSTDNLKIVGDDTATANEVQLYIDDWSNLTAVTTIAATDQIILRTGVSTFRRIESDDAALALMKLLPGYDGTAGSIQIVVNDEGTVSWNDVVEQSDALKEITGHGNSLTLRTDTSGDPNWTA